MKKVLFARFPDDITSEGKCSETDMDVDLRICSGSAIEFAREKAQLKRPSVKYKIFPWPNSRIKIVMYKIT